MCVCVYVCVPSVVELTIEDNGVYECVTETGESLRKLRLHVLGKTPGVRACVRACVCVCVCVFCLSSWKHKKLLKVRKRRAECAFTIRVVVRL